MPKERPASALEALINQVLQRAVQEIARAIQEAASSAATAAPVAPARTTTPKKVRKPRASTPTSSAPVAPPSLPVTAPTAPAPAKAVPAKRAARKPATASAGVNPVEKVLLVIRAEPGLRAEQIERLAELPKAAVQTALAALRKDGRITKSGAGRGTTYTAVAEAVHRPMHQQVRQAIHADIPALIRIRTDVRENRLSNPLSIGTAEYAAFMAHSPIWVFEENGAVCGFAAGDTRNGTIWALFVDPFNEGRGIGRALLQQACDTLRDAGWTTIRLSTAPDTRAERFYRQNGWTPAGWTAHGEVRFEIAP